MACNIKRKPINKYCKGDFRHVITIQNVETGGGFDNNLKRKPTAKWEVNAIIQTMQSVDMVNSDAVGFAYTHLFIIDYFIEYEDIIKNSHKYTVLYNNYVFQIKGVINENLDNKYLHIQGMIRTSN